MSSASANVSTDNISPNSSALTLSSVASSVLPTNATAVVSDIQKETSDRVSEENIALIAGVGGACLILIITAFIIVLILVTRRSVRHPFLFL